MTPFTRQFVAQAGASDRVSVETADAVRGELSGSFDVAVASKFTQVLSPRQVVAALRNIAGALEPGGVLHLFTQVLDDSRLAPRHTASFNFAFLNIYDEGQAYTESEYRSWLAQAGFVDASRVTLPHTPNSIVTARRAG